ncbi:MAG: hypothetical protein PHQ10_04800 [Dehalococcoidales bacterium]|jgi:hypothetical protein|nr:hypothetical protein [Limnochordia bacterium]MDD2252266.1 hypothetical protein [Dehalococcoidales bacterium]MDD4322895.1 hypothetical protein [Dehalococcoidales bacterium]MDD5122170.1 hypothetical protein [Dehalococcoidales bacterium]MDD5498982.1 hypothetical protein [Dehalococcoidales bacterium]
MKRTFISTCLAVALVAVSIFSSPNCSVLAEDTESIGFESIQMLYEQIASSENPEEEFAILPIDSQNALLKAYAGEALEELNNLSAQTEVLVEIISDEGDSGQVRVTRTRIEYNGDFLAWKCQHWIEWTWDSGLITGIVSHGMSGQGYQTLALKWEYVPAESTYRVALSPYAIWYERESVGHFHVYAWLYGVWVKINEFDTVLYDRAFGDGSIL